MTDITIYGHVLSAEIRPSHHSSQNFDLIINFGLLSVACGEELRLVDLSAADLKIIQNEIKKGIG